VGHAKRLSAEYFHSEAAFPFSVIFFLTVIRPTEKGFKLVLARAAWAMVTAWSDRYSLAILRTRPTTPIPELQTVWLVDRL
jgi:hypothetical protein